MDADASTRASIEGLRALLREASVIQTEQYLDERDVALIPQPQDLKLGQVLARYIAMVLLTSKDVRMVFKLHFNPEQIRAYRKSKGASVDLLDDKQLLDFMKELSNQIGGRVCRACDSHGVQMGMSIPLCTRGIHEIYADYETKVGIVTKFGDFWRLDGAFKSIYCSCYVELLSKADLSVIRHDQAQCEEGDLDFL